MAIVIAHHKVKNFAKWKPYFDADAKRRKDAGIKMLAMGRKSSDLNDVYFVWDIKDVKKFQAMGKDPAMKDLMKKAGVISNLSVTVLRDV